MLYEGAIRYLQQAMEAIRNEDHEMRYSKLTHAGEVILALKAAVDMSAGDPQAKSLDAFYQGIDIRIIGVHHNRSLAECSSIINELKNVRDVWDAIDRENHPAA